MRDEARRYERARPDSNGRHPDSKPDGIRLAPSLIGLESPQPAADASSSLASGMDDRSAQHHNRCPPQEIATQTATQVGSGLDFDRVDPPPPHSRWPARSLRQRFEAFMSPEPNTGCWLWVGSVGSHGYGHLSVELGNKRQPMVAHRLSYEMNVGPIPDGMVLDHLCRNRICCNPAHLEVVTHGENIRRGHHQETDLPVATHFACGHPKNAEHTWVAPKDGKRRCRTCVNEWQRQHPNRGKRPYSPPSVQSEPTGGEE